MSRCDNYCEEPAVWSCAECQKSYCTDCDRVLHKPPNMRDHNRSNLEEQTTIAENTEPTEDDAKLLSALKRGTVLRAAADKASQQQFDPQLTFHHLKARVADLFATAIQPFLSPAPVSNSEKKVRLVEPSGAEKELKEWKAKVKLDDGKRLQHMVRVALPPQGQEKNKKEGKKEYSFDGALLYPGEWDQMSEEDKKEKEKEWEGLSKGQKKKIWKKKMKKQAKQQTIPAAEVQGSGTTSGIFHPLPFLFFVCCFSLLFQHD